MAEQLDLGPNELKEAWGLLSPDERLAGFRLLPEEEAEEFFFDMSATDQCELLLGLLGSFETVVTSRVAWDASYAQYFAARQALATEFVDQRVND